MAVSSAYQRRIQALRESSPRVETIEQAQAMKAQAEYEAMSPDERMVLRRNQAEAAKKPLPLYELGKNIVTGETVMTNKPATTMAERDQRLAKFVKSNPAQAARLRGETKPYKGMGTEDYQLAQLADEVVFTGTETAQVPTSSQTPPPPATTAQIPNLLSDLRYFVSPKFRVPIAPQATPSMMVPESNQPPPPLSQSFSPEAQAVLAAGEMAKKAGPIVADALVKGAELAPVVGGLVTRARMIQAAPKVGEFVQGPGLQAVREIQTRGQEAIPQVAESLAPLAVRAALTSPSTALRAGEKIGQVAREVTQYAELNKQIEERARRRSLLGELYPLALADEQRKAASKLKEKKFRAVPMTAKEAKK